MPDYVHQLNSSETAERLKIKTECEFRTVRRRAPARTRAQIHFETRNLIWDVGLMVGEALPHGEEGPLQPKLLSITSTPVFRGPDARVRVRTASVLTCRGILFVVDFAWLEIVGQPTLTDAL